MDKYEKEGAFVRDIEAMLADGLVERTSEDYRTATLTALGLEIAEKAQTNGMLFSQRKKHIWESMRKFVSKAA